MKLLLKFDLKITDGRFFIKHSPVQIPTTSSENSAVTNVGKHFPEAISYRYQKIIPGIDTFCVANNAAQR